MKLTKFINLDNINDGDIIYLKTELPTYNNNKIFIIKISDNHDKYISYFDAVLSLHEIYNKIKEELISFSIISIDKYDEYSTRLDTHIFNLFKERQNLINAYVSGYFCDDKTIKKDIISINNMIMSVKYSL